MSPLRTLLAVALLAFAANAQDILVVAPGSYRNALADWKAHREGQDRCAQGGGHPPF